MTVPQRRATGLGLAAAIFLLDQLLKWFVAGPLGLHQVGDQRVVLPIFAFTRTHNYGVSLGMLTADTPEMKLLLIGATAAIALGVTVWLIREKALGDIVALGMVLGGALGNIVDRVRLGYVLDYADLHFGDFRPFLVFNLADAAITIGVLIVLARSLFMREKPPETQGSGEPPVPETQPSPLLEARDGESK